MEIKEKIDILIVTAADGEDQAVRKIFGEGWNRIAPTTQIKLYWHKITLTSKKLAILQSHWFARIWELIVPE